MLPGMANNPALLMQQRNRLLSQACHCIIDDTSMCENPDLLTPSRRRRIANGSGNTFIEVNKFIEDFNQAKTNDARCYVW